MKLTELEPQFLRLDASDDKLMHHVDSAAEADGVLFVCPKCFQEKGSRIGVHSVLCWRPRVPQTIDPVPGRWEFEGTSYADLTLRAGSSSILLTGGCNAHFFIERGEIRMC